MTAALAGITIKFTPPGGAEQTLNVTSAAARRAGDPSPVGGIDVSWGVSGPLGQPQPSETRLAILSGDPTPYPMNSKVTATVSFEPDDPDNPGSAASPAEIVYGWTDQDQVTQIAANRWRHDLVILDPLQIATDRPVGITRPIESIIDRQAALSAAHPDLLAANTWLFSYESIYTTRLAALDPATSLLDAVHQVAAATGRITANWGSTWSPLVTFGLPRGAGTNPWWITHSGPSGQLIRLTPDDVQAVPSTLSRACRITDVALNYTYGTQAATEHLTTAGSPPFPSAATIDTGIVTDTPTTEGSLGWVRSIAKAVANCGAEPKPALSPAVIQPPRSVSLQVLVDLAYRNRGAVLDLNPTPAGAARLHVAAAGTFTVYPDLTYTLTLTPYPAGLYGLRPARFDDLTAADTFTSAYSSGGAVNCFPDLVATYPRTAF